MLGGSPISKHMQVLTVMIIISAFVFSAFFFPSTKAADQQSGWTTLSPMPTPRGALGVAVVDGKIYAIGGLNGNSPLNNNEMYDPISDQWTVEAPMPTARSGFATAVCDNNIYVIGGTVGTAFVANNEVYDPKSNTWETKASMPTPRADLSANVVNDKIYLIGGKKYSNASPYFTETNENEVYDPVNNTWSTKTPIPTAIYGYASAVLDGKINFVGGSEAPNSIGINVFVGSDQVYDPQTDEWSLAANLPSVATYGAAAATDNYMAPAKLYFMGGYFSGSYSSAIQVYDAENNSWTASDPMPTPRAYFGICVVNDVLYVIGGFDGQNWLNLNYEYKPLGYGEFPPTLEISSPDNQTYSNVSLTFTVNRGTAWVGYSLDNKANITVNGETKLLNLTQGGHTVVLYGNDSFGNMGSSSRVFFSIDTLPPDIKILLPLNQSYSSSDLKLSFTVNKTTQSLKYSLDGAAMETIPGNVTLPALTNGSHELTIYAVDQVGNSGSKTVYFSVQPFPTIMVAAALATAIIALASGYLFMKRRKSSKNIRIRNSE